MASKYRVAPPPRMLSRSSSCTALEGLTGARRRRQGPSRTGRTRRKAPLLGAAALYPCLARRLSARLEAAPKPRRVGAAASESQRFARRCRDTARLLCADTARGEGPHAY
eukprot:828294-Pleurochrysis_carterae.AAC.5